MLKKIVISLIVMCFSMGCFITPAHASDDKHACPTGIPKEFSDLVGDYPYWVDMFYESQHYKGSSVGCNGIEHEYYMSDKPIVVTKTQSSDGSYYYTVDGHSMRVYLGRTFTNDAPTWRNKFSDAYNFPLSDKYSYVTNHDVKLKDTGDIVFPQPPAPVDPEIPIVVPGEEMWTVVLDLIVRSALTIVAVGLLLMGLWISLRLLSKVLKIFSNRF